MTLTVTLAGPTAVAGAQEQLWVRFGVNQNYHIGLPCHSVGDLDRDDACPGGGGGLQLGASPQSPTLARGRITLFGAPPAAACALMLGGPAQQDLGWLGYPGCLQRTTATWAIPMIVASSGPERGLAAIELPVPFGLRGRVASFDVQGVGLVGGGLRFSDGIRLRVPLP